MKKVILSLLSAAMGAVAGIGITNNFMGKTIKQNSAMSNKHLNLFLMMNEWVKVKQEGKNLAEYFARKGYKKIAIYGMSYAGETLLDELSETDIEVVYGIDKNAKSIYLNVNVVTMEENLEEVDAVVVTAITYYDEIEKELSKKLKCPIVSLEDVLYEI
ncbi:MAG: hypothetical protein HFG51_00890 [Lachnospiraceae bacterium]|nr:hypothetical protein [Lachnospiraceae bacterium]